MKKNLILVSGALLLLGIISVILCKNGFKAQNEMLLANVDALSQLEIKPPTCFKTLLGDLEEGPALLRVQDCETCKMMDVVHADDTATCVKE